MTPSAAPVIEAVRSAFRRSPYPGDPFLQGSFDGEEPYDEVRHFKGKSDWSALEPAFLDARYCALGFLSEGGLRFFLPAWLVADLQDALRTADPAFHVTHGLAERRGSTDHRGERIAWEWGPSSLLNPRRYGAMTWLDHARYRLSVFAREEAGAIVEYLRWRQERERGARNEEEAEVIEASLRSFWLERVSIAPTQQELEDRVASDLAEHEARLRRQGGGAS